MLYDIPDPMERLELIEHNFLVLAKASEAQARQLKQQAEMLEQVTKHLKDLSIAIMDLYSRDSDNKQRLTKLEL